ncbi:MAG TPA: glutaredoxin [Polyangiaceae bacterium]|nr:glutaredoxin [Polyangiaceae bacterium]
MASIWGVLERLDYTLLRLRRRLPAHAARRRAAQETQPATAHVAEPPAAQVPLAPVVGDATRPAQIFGRESCLWSGRVVRLLQDRSIEHDYVDLDDPINQSLHVQLVSLTKQQTSPYVFLRGEFIGGYDALSEIDRLGQLSARVAFADERQPSPLKSKIIVAGPPDGDT